jgi:hypothetical protein
MKKIRVKAENGEKFAAALRAAGFEARFCGAGTASTSLALGCSDPDHCPQHEGAYYNPSHWGSVETNASGNQAHQVWFPS